MIDSKKPKTLINPDSRVFSEYALVVYDSENLDVLEIINTIPKGADIKIFKEHLNLRIDKKKNISLGLFKGRVPHDSMLKYVAGELIPVFEPTISVGINTPFLIDTPVGPLCTIVCGEEYKVSITSMLENGRAYYHSNKFPIRITTTAGELSNDFIGDYNGKSSVKFKTSEESIGKKIHITVESERFEKTILELYCLKDSL